MRFLFWVSWSNFSYLYDALEINKGLSLIWKIFSVFCWINHAFEKSSKRYVCMVMNLLWRKQELWRRWNLILNKIYNKNKFNQVSTCKDPQNAVATIQLDPVKLFECIHLLLYCINNSCQQIWFIDSINVWQITHLCVPINYFARPQSFV